MVEVRMHKSTLKPKIETGINESATESFKFRARVFKTINSNT